MRFAIWDRVELLRYSTDPDPIDPERRLTPQIGAIGVVLYSKANRWVYGVDFPGYGVIEVYGIELGRARE